MKDIYGKLREEHVQLLRTVNSTSFCWLPVDLPYR